MTSEGGGFGNGGNTPQKDLEKFKNEIKNEIKDEFKQQTGIILEEFNRNLGFVIDQQQDMRRELNEKIESSAGG